MDARRETDHGAPVPADDEGRGIGELLAAVAANVAAVSVVFGFVALGGVVLATRALRDVAGKALASRAGRPSRRKRTKPAAP